MRLDVDGGRSATECAGPGWFGGGFPEPSDFESTFHHLPGASLAT